MSKKKTCPPPDPNTRVPTFQLPPNSCDAHCHVFGPAAEFPYHPASTYEPPDASKFKLRQLHNKLGVERVKPLGWHLVIHVNAFEDIA